MNAALPAERGALQAGWQARIELDFAARDGRSVLGCRHSGPLRVQKVLYPEGAAHAQALLLHPPAGIAGGDALEIDVKVGAGASALVTTPGAGKWYKANGRRASQHVKLNVAGALEWLPQEAIVFDAAALDARIEVDLEPGAVMIGWDLVALGRAASGERFASGEFAQSIALREAGQLIWRERSLIAGGDALLDSPLGLAGHSVFGCLWAYGPLWGDDDYHALRERCLPAAPLTRLAPRLLVARTVAAGAEDARARLEAVWAELRPRVIGRAAQRPRIWST